MSEQSSSAGASPLATPPPPNQGQTMQQPVVQNNQPPATYEQIEIIAKHGELVLSKIESLKILLHPSSPIPQGLATKKKKSKELLAYLAKYWEAVRTNSKLPKQEERKPGKIPWPVTLIKAAVNPYRLVRYATQWCRMAKKCLVDMAKSVSDFDIRWNQLLTVRFCQIFTAFCRVIIFIHGYPTLKFIVEFVPPYISDIPELRDYIFDGRLTMNFVSQAVGDPFKMIKFHIGEIGEKLNRLAATIGTYIAQLFGPFPLIDWSVLSIFTKPAETPETTLMEDDFFILQNLTLLKDSMIYFVIVFPNATQNNDSFDVVVENLLTESPVIPITVTDRVPVDRFLNYSREQTINRDILSLVPVIARRKFGTAHRKRIQNCTILLEEIKNMCEFDTTLVCRFLANILALCSLGYYELSTYFTYEIVCGDALNLLAVMLDMIKLIKTHKEDIQRFFLYNLMTIDIQYLKTQLQQLGNDSPIFKLLNPLVGAIETLNLEDFDNGNSFYFYGFRLTYGRILLYYNQLRTTDIVSFAEPIFEHLTTIMNHIDYCEDPVSCALKYCPISSLWCYSERFLQHIVNPSIPISKCITLLEVFQYFDLDPTVYIYPGEAEKQKVLFKQVQGSLLNRILQELMKQCSPSSPFYQIGLQTRDLSKLGADPGREHFNLHRFVTPSNILTKEVATVFTAQNNIQRELRNCFARMPQQIRIFDQVDKTSEFFENGITSNFSNFLFPSGTIPESMNVDRGFSTAFQFLWQLFAQMGKAFPRNMFRARLIEGTPNGSEQYLQQVNLMNGTIPMEAFLPEKPHLVDKLQLELTNFLNKDYMYSIYLTPLHGFYSLPNVQLNASDFYSARSLRYMISNLGIYCGFAFDRVITHTIAKCICNIFKVFIEMNTTLADWFNKFKTQSVLPPESIDLPLLTKCSDEMIKLGSAMVLRDLVKTEMRRAINTSVPGLQQIIDAAVDRITVTLSGKEQLICEATSEIDKYYFITQIVELQKIQKQSDFIMFMFFIALLLNNAKWDTVKYLPDYEAITQNLHLFPMALKAFVDIRTTLFISADDLAMETGIKTLFQTFGSIVNQKKKDNPPTYSIAFTRLAITFPRVIDILQFGWIEEVFPNYGIDMSPIQAQPQQGGGQQGKTSPRGQSSKEAQRRGTTIPKKK